jgi:hypothetical protein
LTIVTVPGVPVFGLLTLCSTSTCEVSVLPAYGVASRANCLPTFRDNVLVSSSEVEMSKALPSGAASSQRKGNLSYGNLNKQARGHTVLTPVVRRSTATALEWSGLRLSPQRVHCGICVTQLQKLNDSGWTCLPVYLVILTRLLTAAFSGRADSEYPYRCGNVIHNLTTELRISNIPSLSPVSHSIRCVSVTKTSRL